MFSRRDFLKTGSLAALGGLAAAGSVRSMGFGAFTTTGVPNNFSSKGLKPYVGQMFRFENTETGLSTTLKLEEVAEFENLSQNSEFKTKSVSLLFKGRNAANEQAIYKGLHPALADHDFLMVPVTKDPGFYEIVLNEVVR